MINFDGFFYCWLSFDVYNFTNTQLSDILRYFMWYKNKKSKVKFKESHMKELQLQTKVSETTV